MMTLESARLIVEVADATLRTDLKRKAAIYARHAVPEYWVVDIRGRQIHQLWAPRDEAYTERRLVAFGEPIASSTIAGLTVETRHRLTDVRGPRRRTSFRLWTSPAFCEREAGPRLKRS